MKLTSARGTLWSLVLVSFLAATISSRAANAQLDGMSVLLLEAEDAYSSGDLENAASLYEQAIQKYGAQVGAPAFAKRASIFLLRKRYSEGVEWIDRVALTHHPRSALVLEQKALLLHGMPGGRAEAVTVAEQVVESQDSAFGLHLMIGNYYASGEKRAPQRAAAAYRAFLAKRPASYAKLDQQVNAGLGSVLLQSEEPAAALAAFDRAIALSGPVEVRQLAIAGRCSALVELGQYLDANRTCSEAVANEKARGNIVSQSHLDLATALLRLQRTEQSAKLVASVLEHAPRDVEANLLMGDVLWAQKRFDRAETQFQKTKQLERADGRARLRLAFLYLNGPERRPNKVIAELEAPVRRGTAEPMAAYLLARAHHLEGRPERAIEVLSDSERLLSERADLAPYVAALRADAMLRKDAGLAAEALEGYRAALASAPNHRRARRGELRALNLLAAQALRAGQLERAEGYLRAALERQPKHVWSLSNLGIVLLEAKRYPEAIAPLQRAVRLRPQRPLARRLLAQALARVDKLEAAAEQYAEASALAERGKNQALRKEIEVEWGSVALRLGQFDLAAKSLERALSLSGREELDELARPMLDIARCRRGYSALLARQWSAASADLRAVNAAKSALPQEMVVPCKFALGLALVYTSSDEAAYRVFVELLDNPGPWLADEYRNGGEAALLAYAQYRQGSSSAYRAAERLARRWIDRASGAPKAELRAVLRASLEQMGYAAVGRRPAEAQGHWQAARRYADGEDQARIECNLAVLDLVRGRVGPARQRLRELGSTPPEALVNLGLLFERAGDFAKAYQLWSRAVKGGVRDKELLRWVQAKEELFGFGE